MAKVYLSTVFIVLISLSISSVAQSYKQVYNSAEQYIENENYYKALQKYQELLEEKPNNANLNFKIGFCFLHTATQKAKAIPFLEYAVKYISLDYVDGDIDEESAPLEANYYLGKAYHVNYRFDDAEQVYLDLKKQLGAEEDDFIALINYELEACQIARQLMKTPVEMSVSNLGRNVNSTFDEHSPVISGDESLLIFTSKRKGNVGGRRMDDGQYFEDIYLSSFDGDTYTKAKSISHNINTAGHEASIGLSFNGSQLFIYKDDEGDGNIYVSKRNGADWGTPEKLPEVINSKYRETHASISFDNNEIFFTSDRKGGYGGLDIYRVRKLPNGKWSKAQNLGPTINTEYDEEGPYFHPDGTSLFFASKGHHNMGGFDIFVSFLDEDEKWSVPMNIGYPINTPDDNIYYVPSVDGRRAYYSSYANNSIGMYDIFRIDLAESHVRNQTVIAGIAKTESGISLEDAIITIYTTDDDLVGVYTPDPETGKFLIILPRGKRFKATVEASNYPEMEFILDVPEFSYDQKQQVVIFNDVVTRVGGGVFEEPAPAVAEQTEVPVIKDSAVIIENVDFEMEKDIEEGEFLVSRDFQEEVEEEVVEDELVADDIEEELSVEEKEEENSFDADEINNNNVNANKNNEAVATVQSSETSWYLLGGFLLLMLIIIFIRRKRTKN